jgi:hypothetical protein
MAAEVLKNAALVPPGVGVLGAKRDGLLERCQCLQVAAEALKNAALAPLVVGVVGSELDGLLERGQCLQVAAEVLKSAALVRVRLRRSDRSASRLWPVSR